ncbi:MAG: tyrosine-protein phosphatase [Patescibacteria group bacterium]
MQDGLTTISPECGGGLVLRERGLLRRLIVENLLLRSSHAGQLPPNISEVGIKGLPCQIFRSGRVQMEHISGLQNLGVKRVVSFYKQENPAADKLQKKLQSAGIESEIVFRPAELMDADLVRQIINTVLSDSRTKLINCHAGSNRTGIIIAAIRRIYGENYQQIFRDLWLHGHIPFPKFRHFYREILPQFGTQSSKIAG